MLADIIVQGFNATIFAYGQTGAGKTFTMFGPDDYVPNPHVSRPSAVVMMMMMTMMMTMIKFFRSCFVWDFLLIRVQLWGVVPRACTYIFDKINSSTDDSVEYVALASLPLFPAKI
jgi:hypothetical protein